MNKILERFKYLQRDMKQIEGDGLPYEAKTKSYFGERKLILDEMGKALSDLDAVHSKKIETLKGVVKLLKGGINPHFSRSDISTVYNILTGKK